jgi:branched-chain amino acid transport system permease protein
VEALSQRRAWLISAVVVIALVAVLFARDQEAALVIGVIAGAAYGLVALGLVLIYKSSGVFNFAQGEFGTVAVIALYLLNSNDVPYGVSIVGALVVAAAFGWLTERVVIRPLFDSPRVILLVATAGVALLAIGIQTWFFDAQGRPIDKALATTDRVTILDVQVSDQKLWLIGTLLVLAILLGLFFTRTNLGLAIIGASQEPTATELVGISVRRLSSFTWVLAAVLGGLAAVIAVPDSGSFTPGIMTTAYLIPAFTAAVLGGMTSLPGAFVGGVLVGVVQAVATNDKFFQTIPGTDEPFPGTPSTFVVFVMLLAVLIVRPQGLFGKAS